MQIFADLGLVVEVFMHGQQWWNKWYNMDREHHGYKKMPALA